MIPGRRKPARNGSSTEREFNMAHGIRIKLSKPQSAALKLIRDGQGERAASNTLNSLRNRGLVNETSPIELTETGKAALEQVENAVALAGQIIAAAKDNAAQEAYRTTHAAALPPPGLELLHYTTSTGTGRLCGASRSEWGTVVAGEVTCPACKKELERICKLHEAAAAKPTCARCGAVREHPEISISGFPDAPVARIGLCDACQAAGPCGPKELTRPTAPNASFKVEVIADGSGQWVSNAIRLATKEEAETYGQDLFMRWMLVREKRVVESVDAVNYRWDCTTGLVKP